VPFPYPPHSRRRSPRPNSPIFPHVLLPPPLKARLRTWVTVVQIPNPLVPLKLNLSQRHPPAANGLQAPEIVQWLLTLRTIPAATPTPISRRQNPQRRDRPCLPE
jgi:hypothetical protein